MLTRYLNFKCYYHYYIIVVAVVIVLLFFSEINYHSFLQHGLK